MAGTPDLSRSDSIEVSGDSIRYVDTERQTWSTNITRAMDAHRAWGWVIELWAAEQGPDLIAKRDVLYARLRAAGWEVVDPNGLASVVYAPPGGGPDDAVTVPHAPYPGWREDMESAADRLAGWLVDRVGEPADG